MALREVCGLTTEQIAAAFLASAPTIAQRIVRAKARIRDLALPYVVPGADELEQRMEGVLRVIYLIFTEGYANPERGGSSEALCNEPFDWRGSYATCCLTARSSVSWR